MKRDAEADFPIIRKYAGKLFNLVAPTFSRRIDFEEDDHFGFMVLCFAHKQIEHARSLGILINAGQHADAVILARVMLEGLIYILWARIEPSERALSWRSFALVCDLETLLAMKQRGEIVDEALEQKLRERLPDEASRFLTKRAKKLGPEHHDNPYQRDWNVDKNGRRIEMAAMVAEISDLELKSLYDDLSQLSHWSVRGIGPLIKGTNRGVAIDFSSTANAAKACAVCIQSLAATAKAASEHFQLDIHLELDLLFDSYLAELGVRTNKGS